MVQLNAKSVIVNVLLVPIKILAIPVSTTNLNLRIIVNQKKAPEVLDSSLLLPPMAI